MPISRPDYLHRIFAQLDMMECDATQTNLLCYVDGDQVLLEKARRFVIESKFKEKLCIYRRKGAPSANHIRQRRQRIADIHNELKEIVGKCDYVFLMEDDTLFPLTTLKRLLFLYSQMPFAGLITGVQIGRWGYTVPGVWRVDNPYNVQRVNSMLPAVPPIDPFQEIDAAGLYCTLTKTEFYKSVDFKPFDSILGPDVTYGIELRKQGYRNYIDWNIHTSHLTKRGAINVSGTDLQQITFKRIEADKWEQEVI